MTLKFGLALTYYIDLKVLDKSLFLKRYHTSLEMVKASVKPTRGKKVTSKKISEPAAEKTPLSSESSSDDDDIEGLSSAEEDNDEEVTVTEHKIKKLKSNKEAKKSNENGKTEFSNIIYVSRLPHGFQEKELGRYFSQFGDLKDARLARNKKTGNSRHYGFIEFVNQDDAKIAQETMNNYLVMGHLLKVLLLPKNAKIEKLFKYRKRAFIETPVKKSADELKKNSQAKHKLRLNKLKESGIDFEW